MPEITSNLRVYLQVTNIMSRVRLSVPNFIHFIEIISKNCLLWIFQRQNLRDIIPCFESNLFEDSLTESKRFAKNRRFVGSIIKYYNSICI